MPLLVAVRDLIFRSKIHAAAEESGQRLMVELADAVAETSKR